MPDLIDHALEEFRPGLEANGLHVATVKFEAYPGIADGIIIRQFPLRGAPVSGRDAISVVVSKRKRPTSSSRHPRHPSGELRGFAVAGLRSSAPRNRATTQPRNQMIKIAPSLLSADFSQLAEEMADHRAEADVLHLDVMDGHFVRTSPSGPASSRRAAPHIRLTFDCHLMIEEPQSTSRPSSKRGRR